jgi:hypothetical protein
MALVILNEVKDLSICAAHRMTGMALVILNEVKDLSICAAHRMTAQAEPGPSSFQTPGCQH